MTIGATFMVDEMFTIYINDRELYKTVDNGFLVCIYVFDFNSTNLYFKLFMCM